jgi:hypothetical protein
MFEQKVTVTNFYVTPRIPPKIRVLKRLLKLVGKGRKMLVAHAAVSRHDGSMASKAAPGSFVDFLYSEQRAAPRKIPVIRKWAPLFLPKGFICWPNVPTRSSIYPSIHPTGTVKRSSWTGNLE